MNNPPPKSSGWSAERRAKHAAAIRRWAPWEKSTGPRTKAGKTTSSQNSYKHGGRAAPARALDNALRAQRHFVRAALAHAALKKQNTANELLDFQRAALVRWGISIAQDLISALEDDERSIKRDIYRHKLDRLRASGTLPQQYV